MAYKTASANSTHRKSKRGGTSTAIEDYTIEITNLEFTAVCPKTGLPDFATIRVTYVPDERCVELKSLKSYFLSFRDVGIFHEHVINKVLDDFVAACRPRSVEVVGEFNLRGGLKTVVRASYSAEDDNR